MQLLRRCSQIHIVRHRALAWFGLMHLMSTNMCLWFRTLIFEIMEEFNQNSPPMDVTIQNTTSILEYEYEYGGFAIIGGNASATNGKLVSTYFASRNAATIIRYNNNMLE